MLLPSNEFWGRRSGMWDRSIPKGHNQPIGESFRQQQWGCGANRDGKGIKKRFYWPMKGKTPVKVQRGTK